MWKRVFSAGAIFAGALTAFCSGETYAVTSNAAAIAGGSEQTICVSTDMQYIGSQFVLNIVGQEFESQIVFDDFGGGSCKTFTLPEGLYTASLNAPMGVKANEINYTQEENTVVFTIDNITKQYLGAYGAIHQGVEGTDEIDLPNFPKVFAIGGECTFHKDGTITGETCIDKDGNSHVGREYIDTGTMLFSKANADKDFEIYFEIASYSTTQILQASIFNAIFEDESRNYPGFVLRVANTDASSLELTSRLGTSNASEKKSKRFTTSTVVGKGIRIARINKRIKYSIDGAAYTELDNFTNFSNFFNQITVFGASFTPQNTVFRKFDGTLRNMYIRIGAYEETASPDYTVNFDANGGAVTETERTLHEYEAVGFLPLPEEWEGHNFIGWNTEQDGSGIMYNNNTIVQSDVTLYAQWTVEEEEGDGATPDLDGGTNDTESSNENDGSGGTDSSSPPDPDNTGADPNN